VANIFVNIEKGIEIAADDALKFITGAQTKLGAAPSVVASLGTLLGAVESGIKSGQVAATQGGMNIQLDEQVVVSLQQVWPDVVAFAKTLGINI